MSAQRLPGSLPLIAILRGLPPSDAVAIASALLDVGFTCLETPLNSPQPFKSIAALRDAFNGRMLIGAGTVVTTDDVARAADAGAQFIVAPNVDAAVVAAAKARGLFAVPGFFTASEAFAALAAGADALKLFPADRAGPDYLKALRTVLPAETQVFAVGGVKEADFAQWLAAGAAGFGLGATLYTPGASPDAVRARATALVQAFKAART